MKRSAIVAAVVLFGLIFGAGAGLYVIKRAQNRSAEQHQQHMEPMAAVEVVTAKAIPFQPAAELTGTVFSRRTVRVQNEVSGVVRKVNFQSGDVVQAGQVLAVIDDSTDVADLHAAEASVRVKQADLKVVDARIALAQTEFRRQGEALQVSATSAMELDRAKAELDKAMADRARVQAEIDEARAKVEQTRVRLDKFTLKAPFKGRVGMRNIHEGQFLPPQMGIGGDAGAVAVIEEIADTIYLDFAIPQEQMPRVEVGMTVAGSSPLYGDKPMILKVVAIDAAASTETRNVRVRSEVDNRAGLLRSGMSVQVRVPVDLPVSYVAVPVTAVRRASYGDAVYVAEKDEKGVLRARQRFVKLGPPLTDPAHAANPGEPGAAWVAVLDGVKAGEQVAAVGSFKLMPGAMVIPVDAKAAPAESDPPSRPSPRGPGGGSKVESGKAGWGRDARPDDRAPDK
ncbi:MAG: efflux RND transporter periplasmic adaptor subunit [Phycisphaerales bacterium]|nr:efflux RND transporter periplasmic adaptor subunit [Phycisphaerales bacterium]